MTKGTQLTTVLVAVMVAISMIGMAAPAGAQSSTDQTIETLDNDEDLYLAFGVDLGDMTLEEYVEAYVDDNPSASSDADAEVIQYQDVGQVNIVEDAEAVSVAMGEGAEATAIQEVDQQNANSQIGEASADNYVGPDHETTFENVGDVYVVMGNGPDKSYDGWGIVDDNGDVTVTQTAEATVSQAQEVSQTNVAQNVTALAYAENESDATAVQLTEQSNLNVQQGAAAATNVAGVDYDGDKDRKHYHEKKHDGEAFGVDQTADATVEQVQEVEQANAYQQGSAVAIAAGDNATATAVQITDQSNLNEQVGTAEAMNVLMDSAGMHVATASVDGGTDIVDSDSTAYDPHDDKKDKKDDGDVTQTAEASVTQYQSVEQANLNLNSSAQAVAANNSSAQAVQMTFQENINAQVASADALNVFLEESAEEHDKKDKLPKDDEKYEGAILTETTTANVHGEPVDGAEMTAFDYDGTHEQLNSVDQDATAEIEQVQNVTQFNLLDGNNAIAIADDDGSANAFQLTIQENENAQISSAESTTFDEGPIGEDDEDEKDDKDEKDDEKDEKDDEKDDSETEKIEATEADDEQEADDSMPGLGVGVALVALLAAAMLAVRAEN